MPHALAREVAHRPWPLPSRPWVLFQSWQDLLFLHWRVDAARLRPLVPPELELDEHEGSAWLGVVPFAVRAQRLRFLPRLPGVTRYLELNVRTYVRHGGRAGVFFLSLEADSRLAVLGARAGYGLPYFRARMRLARAGGEIEYASERVDGPARFHLRYRASGAPALATPGTRAHFLVERYALFVVRRGRVLRADIHHAPWRLQSAEARVEHDSLTTAAGLAPPDGAPLLHFAARQDTWIWAPAPD